MGSNFPSRSTGQPTDLTIKDFKANRALGRASFIGSLANSAAEKICGLYGKSPSSIVKTIPFGSGAIDNSRGIFDDLCEDIAPPPPPPQSQFQGGQCDGIKYRVAFSINYEVYDNSPEGKRTDVFSGIADVNGGVTGFRLAAPGQSTAGIATIKGFSNLICVCRGERFFLEPPGTLVVIAGDASFGFKSIASATATRVDGQPDNCGNPPPSYPAPTALPDDLDGTTVINIAPNFPVTVPVRIVPTIAPIVNIFRPEFNVDVGGINVNISAGGFTFTPTVQIDPNVRFPISDPRPNPPAPITITPNTPAGGGDCGIGVAAEHCGAVVA